MPVRGSTAWQHAIIERKVINMDHDGNRKVACAWDTCERDGYEVHKVRVQNANTAGERVMNYVFCSERHKYYWLESATPGRFGRLPAGMKLSIM